MSTKTTAGKVRKQRFFAALALVGLTQNEWAEQEGITDTHLYLVLSGRRESRRLIEKVEAFIAEHLPEPASAA